MGIATYMRKFACRQVFTGINTFTTVSSLLLELRYESSGHGANRQTDRHLNRQTDGKGNVYKSLLTDEQLQ